MLQEAASKRLRPARRPKLPWPKNLKTSLELDVPESRVPVTEQIGTLVALGAFASMADTLVPSPPEASGPSLATSDSATPQEVPPTEQLAVVQASPPAVDPPPAPLPAPASAPYFEAWDFNPFPDDPLGLAGLPALVPAPRPARLDVPALLFPYTTALGGGGGAAAPEEGGSRASAGSGFDSGPTPSAPNSPPVWGFGCPPAAAPVAGLTPNPGPGSGPGPQNNQGDGPGTPPATTAAATGAVKTRCG